MKISLTDLVIEMQKRGYRTTSSGIRYYVQKGLLPNPVKIGLGHRSGVQLFFPDKDEVCSRLFNIFELKGRGFKLAEIRDELKDQQRIQLDYQRKIYLDRFLKKNDQFFLKLEREPDDRWAKSLGEVLKDPDVSYIYLQNRPCKEDDVDQITNRRLYLASYLYDDQPVYLDHDIWDSFDWLKLRIDHEIHWDTLEALHEKHADNFKKYFFWPDTDGERFTETYLGWRRQMELNSFGKLFKEYIERIITKTLTIMSLDYIGEVPVEWDYRYDNIESLIEDFLGGQCAFMPTSDPDVRCFLKKIVERRR